MNAIGLMLKRDNSLRVICVNDKRTVQDVITECTEIHGRLENQDNPQDWIICILDDLRSTERIVFELVCELGKTGLLTNNRHVLCAVINEPFKRKFAELRQNGHFEEIARQLVISGRL